RPNFAVLAHRARAYFGAAECGAGIGEERGVREIPSLQEPEGKAAHEGVASASTVYDADVESGNMVHGVRAGEDGTFHAHRHGNNFGAEGEKLGGDFFVVRFAGDFAGCSLTRFQNIDEL